MVTIGAKGASVLYLHKVSVLVVAADVFWPVPVEEFVAVQRLFEQIIISNLKVKLVS
jgi:hypothetical protein